MLFVCQIWTMKTRRLSSNRVNKRQTKTNGRGRNIKSKPMTTRSKVESQNSNSRGRILRINRNAKPNLRKRVANKQPKGIVIRRSSGRREKFSTDRMTQTVSRSGVPFMMARDISKRVTKKRRSHQEKKLFLRGKSDSWLQKNSLIETGLTYLSLTLGILQKILLNLAMIVLSVNNKALTNLLLIPSIQEGTR